MVVWGIAMANGTHTHRRKKQNVNIMNHSNKAYRKVVPTISDFLYHSNVSIIHDKAMVSPLNE